MKIPKNIIKDFLEPYELKAKYLQSAEEDNLKFKGYFSIIRSVYAKKNIDSGHFNWSDFSICYNQLMYVGIANALKNKNIPELSISYDYFKKNQLNPLLYSFNLFWKEIIDPKNFIGIIEISDIVLKKEKNKYYITTKINFEEGKLTGLIKGSLRIK